MVNANISTNNWHQVDITDTNDLVAIQLDGLFGAATIINIYNDQNYSTTLTRSDTALTSIRNNAATLPPLHEHYIVWAGDFNRHHPRWDEERNRQLFTAKALDESQYLIDIADEHHLDMALLKDLPTVQVQPNNNWTQTDNVFLSTYAMEVLVKCTTLPEERGPCMDHIPIDTMLDLPIIRNPPHISFNFHATDWDKFTESLEQCMARMPPPKRIETEEDFHQRVAALSMALIETVERITPKSKPVPHSKRWWNKDLENLCKIKNRLNTVSYCFRHDQHHPSHAQLRDASNKFTDAIQTAKQSHWENFLEEMDDGSLWTAAKYHHEFGGVKRRLEKALSDIEYISFLIILIPSRPC